MTHCTVCNDAGWDLSPHGRLRFCEAACETAQAHPEWQDCPLCNNLGTITNATNGQIVLCPHRCRVAWEHQQRKQVYAHTNKFRFVDSASQRAIAELSAFSFESWRALPRDYQAGKGLAYGVSLFFATRPDTAFSLREVADSMGYTDFEASDIPRQWVLLIGPNGTGKTCLAAAAANKLAKQGKNVFYTRFDDLYRQILDTYNHQRGHEDSVSEMDILQTVIGVDVLILDEISVSNVTENKRAILESLVRGRMQAGRPTLFTSNWGKAELVREWGERITTILFMAHIVELTGKVIRPESPTVKSF